MTVNFNLGFVADAAGTVDAITATYTPTYTVLLDKMLVWFRATGANTSTTPTFSPNGLTARTIVKQGGQPLVAGDIPRAGAIMEMVYDATNTRWELVNPAHIEPYKKYVALLTQTGTNAPVATVLENTLGGTVVWTYLGVGDYVATLASAFTSGKTVLDAPSNFQSTQIISMFINTGNTNELELHVLDNSFNNINGQLSDSKVEIRVYY